MTGVVETSDAMFEADVLKAGQPVLVDFWAQWCGPCKAMAPALQDLAAEMAGTVGVVKAESDRVPGAMIQYGVRSMPTLMLFKGGQPVAVRVGAMSKAQIAQWVRSAV